MKKVFFTLVGVAVLALPVATFAGVSGSPHDMSAYGGTGTPTADAELCFGCHIPHGAQGDKLWAMDASAPVAGMSTIQRLCYTCHDDGIAELYAPFNLSDGLIDHTAVGDDCSGVGACHDVHEMGDGKFLAEGAGTNNSLCENCHDATPHADYTGTNKLAAGNHLIGTAANSLVCEDCHGAHTGVNQGTGSDTYILRADNTPTGGQWGAMCIACHNNQAPFTGDVSEVFNYSQAPSYGLTAKHPTFGGTYTLSGCNECHTVHGTTDYGYLLNAASHNSNANFCATCHTVLGSGAPPMGATTASHYMGTVATWTGTNTANLPWSNEINDDGNGTPDWSSAAADMMVCETCHSVHKNGNAGFFTRIAQTDQNELCSNCHQN